MSATIIGSHFVGSLNTDSAEESFALASELAGDSFRRIPDGEFGERFYWLQFQSARLEQAEGISRVAGDPVYIRGQFDQRPLHFDGTVAPADVKLPGLGYAEAAISSYQAFRKAKEDGLLGSDVRLQVSLPTPIAVATAFFIEQDRPALAKLYTAKLLEEIHEIIAVVPAKELAFQFDIAVEFAFIEGALFAAAGTWYGDPIEDSTTPLAELIDAIPAEVEVGLHLCYGDIEEAHFFEPVDSSNLVKFTHSAVGKLGRQLNWLHLPVPIARTDDEYYRPLADLKLQPDTEVYLGLLHREDTPEQRIAAASKVLSSFGVSTECGFGRGPKESVRPLFAQHNTAQYA